MKHKSFDIFLASPRGFCAGVERAIETVKQCLKKHGKPVSICGEIAGDIIALPLFVGMGVDVLSMNPSRIFDLCRMVPKIDADLVRHLVEPVLASGTSQAVTGKLENYLTELQKKRN